MKKNKYGLVAGIGIGMILAIGGISVANIVFKNNKQNIVENNHKENMVGTTKTSNKSTTQTNKQQDNEAILVAEKFMNEYMKNENFEDWLSKQSVSDNFRKILNERIRANELNENYETKEMELSEEDRDLVKKYSDVYEPVLAKTKYNTNPYDPTEPGRGKFKATSWDEKTGIVVLNDEISPEFKIRLVKSSGKWLVDDVEDAD